MEWHYQYLHSSAILAGPQLSFVLNYIHCFEWWCQKFLPEFSSISVALRCSPLTLSRRGTGSLLLFLGKDSLKSLQTVNCFSIDFWRIQSAESLLKPDVKFACSLVSSKTGTLCLIRTKVKFKVQRMPAKWNPLHSLASLPSYNFLCLIRHIQWGIIMAPSHPLSKFFVLSFLCPVFFMVFQSCWNNKLQTVHSVFFVSLS